MFFNKSWQRMKKWQFFSFQKIIIIMIIINEGAHMVSFSAKESGNDDDHHWNRMNESEQRRDAQFLSGIFFFEKVFFLFVFNYQPLFSSNIFIGKITWKSLFKFFLHSSSSNLNFFFESFLWRFFKGKKKLRLY